MSSKKRMSMPVKILLGMVLGICVGICINHFIGVELITDLVLVRLFNLVGHLFLNMFRMIVVPVVLVSMIKGVTSMNNPVLLGRVGIKTLLIFIVTTLLSSFMGIVASLTCGIGKGATITIPASSNMHLEGHINTVGETLSTIVPTNIFKSAVEANMLQILFIAVIGGLALAQLQKKTPIITQLLDELDALNIKVVELIMSIAPFGVFCLLADTFANFGIGVLLPLSKYIICIVAVTAILIFVIYPAMLLIFTKTSPLLFFKNFSNVMLLAFSTCSSNATIPSNIEVMTGKMGVSKSIATFIISLGATINMNGTAIMQGCASVFIAQLYGIDLTYLQIIKIISMCLIASVGTAGMPGAGVIMLGLVLESVGLPLSGIALVLGVDRIIDMFRTTANITGDAITAIIVNSSEEKRD